MKNPCPHFGQLLFFLSNLSPFFSYSFHIPFVGGPFLTGAFFASAIYFASAAAGAVPGAAAFSFFFGSILVNCSFVA